MKVQQSIKLIFSSSHLRYFRQKVKTKTKEGTGLKAQITGFCKVVKHILAKKSCLKSY
jgi:hypothetical protein